MNYTSERNNQILVGLLKYHGIKKVIISPGANNVSFAASIQSDSFFEVYSCVDERSAAYIACGMSAESGEPVVISCTGATASRNYLPALTEAYYRHLPILAVTSTMPIVRIGHNFPQCIDRTNVINDVAKLSVQVPIIKDSEDEWICNVRINKAILELKHRVSGPVHINLETKQEGTFDVVDIKDLKPIERIYLNDSFPELKGKIAIFVGAHQKWNDELTKSVELFCEKYNAVVWYDHTSNYKGKYKCLGGLTARQIGYNSINFKMDILIHIGDISGAYYKLKPKQVWRISNDGELCDNFKALRYVFEMEELDFFRHINKCKEGIYSDMNYYKECQEEYKDLLNKIPLLPFSNISVAKEMAERIPENSVLHFGILNSLRSWNYFNISDTVLGYANTGGFGIDGCVSSMMGAAIVNPHKLYFGIVGDLAFFYDMNVMGNRHFPNNMRLLIINNGRGQEFRNYGHRASQFGNETDLYIAAAGHYGEKSKELVRDYVKNLGFEYLTACNENELSKNLDIFLDGSDRKKPIVFEVFTDTNNETEAGRIVSNLGATVGLEAKQVLKKILKVKK